VVSILLIISCKFNRIFDSNRKPGRHSQNKVTQAVGLLSFQEVPGDVWSEFRQKYRLS
jgi:hypothetical protein